MFHEKKQLLVCYINELLYYSGLAISVNVSYKLHGHLFTDFKQKHSDSNTIIIKYIISVVTYFIYYTFMYVCVRAQS